MIDHRSTTLPECGPTETSAPEPCFLLHPFQIQKIFERKKCEDFHLKCLWLRKNSHRSGIGSNQKKCFVKEGALKVTLKEKTLKEGALKEKALWLRSSESDNIEKTAAPLKAMTMQNVNWIIFKYP